MSSSQAGTIQRCPHDSKNPYTMILNDLIRDKSISPNCRWLLIYLLSNADGWKISVAQVREHLKEFMGRDKVRSIFDEAIDAGYIFREETRDNGRHTGVKYYVSENPKFKKSVPRPENPGPVISGPTNQYTKKEQEEKKEQQERIVCVDPALVEPPPRGETPPVVLKKKQELPLKKVIPDDKPAVEKIVLKRPDNCDIAITKQDLYTACIQERLDWTKEEIDDVWKVLEKYDSPVRNWPMFCDGVIKNKRKMAGIKNLDLKEKKCPKKKLTRESTPTSKKSCEPSKEKTSEKDTLVPLFPHLRPPKKPVT